MIGDIGETAGEIWDLLNEQGEVSLSGLKSKIDRKNLVEMSLGWLAREDKITLYKYKNGTRISLK
ncbi:MAG: winged helix-turn-helix domain-containing protein [Halobacteriota archaeon]|nr:winged helix-turn-helix domain-containing protein [Halobacteriota archaeon]